MAISTMLNGMTVDYVPRSSIPDLIALYKMHQRIGVTNPGWFDWRLKRQFSTYFPKGNSQVIGAYKLGKIVGFVAWNDDSILDHYSNEIVPPSKNGTRGLIRWQDQLLVDAQYRRRGIGSVLMQEFISISKDLWIRNSVWQEWLIDFYAQFGFKLVKTDLFGNQRYWILYRKPEE
jgi:GNAT superfamily N-acetyltransferase